MTVKLEGPHELAWSMMLDVIYADAYRHDIGDIRFAVGIDELHEEIALREGFARHNTADHAAAWLCKQGVAADEHRLYLVERVGDSVQIPAKWALDRTYYVFTWRARWMGVFIRLAQALRQPQWVDKAMYRMRKVFFSERATPSYYKLHIWTRKG